MLGRLLSRKAEEDGGARRLHSHKQVIPCGFGKCSGILQAQGRGNQTKAVISVLIIQL